jgi:DNA (cytosine-5)-methyltransferase 1
VDLLAGGPPCPPFSKSRFYRKEKPRALDDPVADATLSGYLRVLRTARPRAFLLENVPGLGYDIHSEALQFIEREASALGYETNWAVLNAADYGVPQIRERFFMMGSLRGQIPMPEPTHTKAPGTTLLNAALPPWRTAGEVLADLDTEESADDTGHFAGGQYHDLLCQIPPGDNYLYFTEKRGHPNPVFEWRKRYWSFLLKLSPDMPSWTIQARRSNNMGPFHWRNRILRIEEVKRLQTFPDDWWLAGKIEDQWRQVGNAVPALLAEALGGAVAAHLGKVRDA